VSTVPRLLLERAAATPERVVFRHKHRGIWQPIDWRTYADRTAAFALGLESLGVGPGDRVAIHSENRPEWVYADVATESLRAIVVGVYPTNPTAELRYLLQNSGSKVVICEDQEQLDKAIEALPDCPEVEHLVIIDPRGTKHYDEPKLVTYDEIERRGAAAVAAAPHRFAELVAATEPADPAVIVYTSGTTGPPKGAVLSHRNGLSSAAGFGAGIGVDGDEVTVSYLPLCHLAERVWTIYAPVLWGVQVNFAESIATVQRDIYEIAPTFFGAVPRIADKMRAGVEIKMQDAAWFKRKNYAYWMAVGHRLAAKRLANGGRLGPADRLRQAAGDLMLYRPLRTKLGLKNVRHYLVGTAPVAPELMEWFHAIGLRMFQTYGQTECGGASHAHGGWDIRFESVGVPFAGVECRIDTAAGTTSGDDAVGEVLLRGEGVFCGYWDDPAATAATVDPDGWLHTGDVGVIDPDGHLRIVGRMKDIIITAGGKNISPAEIENKLAFSPYVKEAIVIGEGRKYLGALIGIEYETVAHWAERHDLTFTTYKDLASRPEVVGLIGDWVGTVNRELAQVETVKRFVLLPKELDHDDDELTATQKVRRSSVEKRYADLVEELYA
jgi:long-chain acyl-CoA synthetase